MTRFRRLRTATAITCATFLSGCTGFGTLSGEGPTAQNASVWIPRPCVHPLTLAATNPRLDLKLASFSAAPDDSDLAVGRNIVRAAASGGATVGFVLGAASTSLDLAQFEEDDGFVSEHGVAAANSATAEVLDELQIAVETGRGGPPTQAITVHRSHWESAANAIYDATADDGWAASLEASIGHYYRIQSAVAAVPAPELAHAALEVHRKFLLAEYMKAYFRNGQIFAVKVTTDELKNELKTAITNTIKDPNQLKAVQQDIDNLGDVVGAVCGKGADCLSLGMIGETTFVTRSGKSFGFPGITATIQPASDKKIAMNAIDKWAVIGDLVRVLVEASFDAALPVPGVPNSTACTSKAKYLCGAPGDEAKIAKVNDAGDRAEAGVKSAVGIAIRGGWLLSLNNEALADTIETGVSVAARKSVEAAAWPIVNHQCPNITTQPDAPLDIRVAR